MNSENAFSRIALTSAGSLLKILNLFLINNSDILSFKSVSIMTFKSQKTPGLKGKAPCRREALF
jgi:hypothetical protein